MNRLIVLMLVCWRMIMGLNELHLNYVMKENEGAGYFVKNIPSDAISRSHTQGVGASTTFQPDPFPIHLPYLFFDRTYPVC